MSEQTREDKLTRGNPQINREIAVITNGQDITRGYLGPLLEPYDTVLRDRSGFDLRLYESVLSDAMVKGALEQRQLAVTKCEWSVEPGGPSRQDKKAAEFMKQQLHHIGWDNVTKKMLFGVFYGYAVSELIYARDGAQITLDECRVRHRRRFRFDNKGHLRLLTYEHMLHGLPAEPPYFWHFEVGADHDDEPYGLGLAHWLYWPVLFKRQDMKFWLIFLEKFGMPTAKGSYPSGAGADEKQALLNAVSAITTDAGVIMPDGMAVELIEAARSGTADYKDLHTTMDEAISRIVLGQTATIMQTSGRLGSDKTHDDTRADIIKADSDLVCESWNTGPARWLTEWNFPNAKPPRVYRVVDPPEDMDLLATRDKTVFDMGFKPTLSYIQETYGEGWEEQAQPTPPAQAPQGQSAAGQPPATGLPPANASDGTSAAFAAASDVLPDAAQRMAGRASAQVSPAVDAWIGKIRHLAETADDMQGLRDGLMQLMPDMSLDEYTGAMQQALAAAALAGRYELLKEAGAS